MSSWKEGGYRARQEKGQRWRGVRRLVIGTRPADLALYQWQVSARRKPEDDGGGKGGRVEEDGIPYTHKDLFTISEMDVSMMDLMLLNYTKQM